MISLKKIVRNLQSLLRQEHGSVLPFVGLGIMVLLGSTGIAIDMGRVQIVQAKMSNALDEAGLAAGADISTTNLTTEVNNYFYANFPSGYMNTTITSLTASANSDNSIITLAAAGTVPTTFMQLFGIKSVAVSASSQITRASKGMELVLVLDNTGSMNCLVTNENSCSPTGGGNTKIAALKTAAAELLDILYGNNATLTNLWVGVVPFSQTVNIGSGFSSWLDTSANSTTDYGPTLNGTNCQTYTGTSPSTSGAYSSSKCGYTISTTSSSGQSATFNGNSANWSGCVMARTAPYDTSDDVPGTAPFPPFVYPYTADAGNTPDPWRTVGSPVGQSCTTKNGRTTCPSYKTTTTYNYSAYTASNYSGNYGPDLYCPQPLLPMVAEKSTVLTEVNSLTAGGSTLIDMGLAWGQRMLSPKWQGLWGGEMNTNNLPLAYNTPLMNKVLILMTDGENEFDGGNYTAYKFLDNNVLGTTNATTANTDIDTKTLAICTALKANGVIIYTVGFGTSSDVNTTLLTSCASKPEYFFLAPTNAQLEEDFSQIGDSLANLRISQ